MTQAVIPPNDSMLAMISLSKFVGRTLAKFVLRVKRYITRSQTRRRKKMRAKEAFDKANEAISDRIATNLDKIFSSINDAASEGLFSVDVTVEVGSKEELTYLKELLRQRGFLVEDLCTYPFPEADTNTLTIRWFEVSFVDPKAADIALEDKKFWAPLTEEDLPSRKAFEAALSKARMYPR